MGKKENRKKIPIKNQKKQSPIKREIKGIIFILLGIFIGGALIYHYPSDPGLFNLTPTHGHVKNIFGIMGSWISDLLLLEVGMSSILLSFIFIIAGACYFIYSEYRFWSKKIFALILLVFSLSGLLTLIHPIPIKYHGGKILAGGRLGLFLSDKFIDIINRQGSYLIFGTLVIVSLMIITKLSFVKIFSGIWLIFVSILRALNEYRIKIKERKRKRTLRKRYIEEQKRPKEITITKPPGEAPKKPKQEAFSFMFNDKITLPPLKLLNDPPKRERDGVQKEALEMNARILEKKLKDFGVEGDVVEIIPGPVITMYEFKPAPGVKISKVAGLSDDLALALRAQSIRIVAPIPGKAVIGIEIPNNKREMVYLKEIISSDEFQESNFRLPIALGKDIMGLPVVTDLYKMPHLLVAGATGTGKSISLNAMINSLLFKFTPDLVRLIMIDPKRIELSVYNDIPHLLHPVVTDPKVATKALKWAVNEMERRYEILSEAGVRTIETYNKKILKQKGKAQEEGLRPLSYIVIVIDELADLMMVSSREVEEAITRLAQMARAAGIHLIIATQRPSVDVLTGIIKANFPARISFQVSSKVDSRTILDTIGAEALLGDGDMLFMPPGIGKLKRIHGAFISEDEVKRVTEFLKSQTKPEYKEEIITEFKSVDEIEEDEEILVDEKYQEAVELVLKTGQASISMIQRKLRVGYNRAARMIEAMEKEGIVGPSDGVRPRQVFGRKDD